MEFQTDLHQPLSESVPHLAGLPLTATVDYRIVAVPLEGDLRELPRQPYIERVMQIQIRQYGRTHAPNAMGNFCFEVTLGYRRLELLPRVESKGRHNG